MSLSITISTNQRSIDLLIKKCNRYFDALVVPVEFLIVWQCDRDDVSELSSHIRVLRTSSRGLSNARNLALEYSRHEWVWFQDDDFHLNCDKLNLLDFRLFKDLVFFPILALDGEHKKFYKSHRWIDKFRFFRAFSASSIGFFVRRNVALRLCVNFDPRLGLGSSLPACEENLFLYRLLNNGVCFMNSRTSFCRHTCLMENRNSLSIHHIYARRYLLNNCDFFTRNVFKFIWVLKYIHRRNIPSLSIYGFFKILVL